MMIKLRAILFFSAVVFHVGCATTTLTPAQEQEIREAAAKVLPAEAKVEVDTEPKLFSKPDLVIAAHLLEGHSPDETNPYVRGDYGTHEKLTRLVRFRSAKVLKSVFSEVEIPDVGRVVIRGRHGVRQYYVGSGSPGSDVAMTIYQVSLSTTEAAGKDWDSLEEEDVMAYWSVDKNIIPALDFRTVPY